MHLLDAFFPEPSRSCFRPNMPSCSTVWVRSGSTGIVADFSASLGIGSGAVESSADSNSREPLSLISDWIGRVESATLPSSRLVLGPTAPEPDWREPNNQERWTEKKFTFELRACLGFCMFWKGIGNCFKDSSQHLAGRVCEPFVTSGG